MRDAVGLNIKQALAQQKQEAQKRSTKAISNAYPASPHKMQPHGSDSATTGCSYLKSALVEEADRHVVQTRELSQFDIIDAAFSGLTLRNERLWFTEGFGRLGLGKVSLETGFLQAGTECGIRFLVGSRGQSGTSGGRPFVEAYLWISQNRISSYSWKRLKSGSAWIKLAIW